MKSALNRRLKRLEGTRGGVATLSDEALDGAIDLLVAQVDGRPLTPSEAAELACIQSRIDVSPSPLGHAELVAKVHRDLKALGRPGLAALSK